MQIGVSVSIFLFLSFCQFHFSLAQNSCVFHQYTLPSDFIYKSRFCFPFTLSFYYFGFFFLTRVKIYVIAAWFTTRVFLFYLSANQIVALFLARWSHLLLFIGAQHKTWLLFFSFIKTRTACLCLKQNRHRCLALKYTALKCRYRRLSRFISGIYSRPLIIINLFPANTEKKSSFVPTSSASCFIQRAFFVTRNMRTLKAIQIDWMWINQSRLLALCHW